MDKSACIECEDNFYNGNNPYGIDECWCFKKATLIMRKQVAVHDVPPWTWKPKLYPSCYRRRGFIFIDCSKGDRMY